MSNIYQKIKGKAEKLRKSYVSLGSEDGSVSPTKLNQTLVEGSKGLSEKFVNHADALMQGFNETVDEDGMSFGEDLASDGKKENFDGVTKYASPAKNKNSAADEAADALKKTKTKREGEFQNEEGDALDVYDITETTPGSVQEYSTDWDVEAAGGLSYEEWIKQPGNKEKEDAFVESMTTPGEEKKSVEMNVRPEEKEETTEGEKAEYNMGWMESRNAKRARRVQLRDNKKKTRQYNRLIKKFEKGGGNKNSESMPPEVREAYAHFTKDGASSKFDTPIGSTTGINKPSETKITKGNEKGAEGAVTLDKDGNPINYGSPTKFGAIAATLGKAVVGKVASKAADKLTSGINYKMKGSSFKKNK